MGRIILRHAMDLSIIAKIARDVLRWDRLEYPRSSILTLAHDNDRSLLYQGRWYSPLVDTLEDDLGIRGVRCLSVARIISRIKGEQAYGSVVSPEGAFARALLGKRLVAAFSRGRYAYSTMEERIWAKILDATGARAVVGIQPSRELCVASRGRGVWIADVQHGVISESHPWYGAQFRADDPEEQLPNAFLCWDFGSQEVIDQWAKSKSDVRTIVTGNRWVRRFLWPQSTDAMAQSLLNTYQERKPDSLGRPTILVALSWGDINIPNGFMVDALRDVIKSTANKYQWLVRLHPNQLNGFATHEGRKFRDYFRRNLQGYTEWESTTKFPLPLVLAQVDLHISWNSSVSIEAAQMGIRTALMDPRLRSAEQKGDYYDYYRRIGKIDLIEATFDSISSWIQYNLGTRTEPEDFKPYDVEYNGVLDKLVAMNEKVLWDT